MNGDPNKDQAYPNGLADYEAMIAKGIAVIYFVKKGAKHGEKLEGDRENGKGDFNTVNLAWLNWQLKSDEGETGKALFIGPDCKSCDDRGWEFSSTNID